MTEVEVKGLVKRECDSVIIEGDIILCGSRGNGVVGQPGKDFFNIANANCTTGW